MGLKMVTCQETIGFVTKEKSNKQVKIMVLRRVSSYVDVGLVGFFLGFNNPSGPPRGKTGFCHLWRARSLSLSREYILVLEKFTGHSFSLFCSNTLYSIKKKSCML